MKHKIPSTINSLLNELSIHQPERPYAYIIQKLQERKEEEEKK
jgi:hypothetical protein